MKPEFIDAIDAANTEIKRLHAKVEEAAAARTVGCPTCGRSAVQPAAPPPAKRATTTRPAAAHNPSPSGLTGVARAIAANQQQTTTTQPAALRDASPFKGMTGIARAIAANQLLQQKKK